MYQPSIWKTDKDIERDLLLFAEYTCMPPTESNKETDIRIPDTILKYNKQMTKNKMSTLNSDLDHDNDTVSYVVSGRGRGVKDRVLRPGECSQPDPFADEQLKKKIRNVCGLGHSNELIEHTVQSKRESASSGNTESSDESSDFKLVSAGTLSSSSSSSASKKRTSNKYQKRSSAMMEAAGGEGPSMPYM